jgi:hypothetical protein
LDVGVDRLGGGIGVGVREHVLSMCVLKVWARRLKAGSRQRWAQRIQPSIRKTGSGSTYR